MSYYKNWAKTGTNAKNNLKELTFGNPESKDLFLRPLQAHAPLSNPFILQLGLLGLIGETKRENWYQWTSELALRWIKGL